MRLILIFISFQIILNSLNLLAFFEGQESAHQIIKKLELLYKTECHNGIEDWVRTNNLKVSDCLNRIKFKLNYQDLEDLNKTLPLIRVQYSKKQNLDLNNIINHLDLNSTTTSDLSEYMANLNQTASFGSIMFGSLIISFLIVEILGDIDRTPSPPISDLGKSDQSISDLGKSDQSISDLAKSDQSDLKSDKKTEEKLLLQIQSDIKLKEEEIRTKRIKDCEYNKNKPLNPKAKNYLETILINAKICAIEVTGQITIE